MTDFAASMHDAFMCKCGRSTRINNVLMPFEIRCIKCGRKLRDAVEPDATIRNEEALRKARVRSSSHRAGEPKEGGS